MYALRQIIISSIYYLNNYIVKACNRNVRIGLKTRIALKSKFEGYNKVDHHSYFKGEIGLGSYIGSNSIVTGRIGRFCSIADNVKFINATHPIKNFVSTHPAFYSLNKPSGLSFVTQQKFNEKPKLEGEEYPFIVGNDVYIGYGVTLIGPLIIGDGAVIAANSTVTKNVEPYSVIAGTPAKEIKKRFSNEEIEFLNDFKWWEKEIAWLKKNADTFEDIQKFINSHHM